MMPMRFVRLATLLLWLSPGLATISPAVWHAAIGAAANARAAAKWENWKKVQREPARSDDPAAWLSIPGCGIEQLILREATEANLHRAPCFQKWRGPEVILGHRDSHLRPLQHIREGAAVHLERADGRTARYRVVHYEVTTPTDLPARIETLAAPGDLFLVTCHPFKYIGPAPNRFLVQARPVRGTAAISGLKVASASSR